MKLSEINAVLPYEVSVIREGEFEKVFLVGKNQKHDVPVIAFLGNVKFLDGIMAERPECLICTESIAKEIADRYSGGIATCDNPKTAFFLLHNFLSSNRPNNGVSISPTAVIHPTAVIGTENVAIGDNVRIDAFAVVNNNVEIGSGCHIYEHAVIGTPGFYYFMCDGKRTLVNPAGKVILGENVAVHTNSSVEYGVVVGDTVIGDNTVIDNTCLIGHDSLIGQNCTIAAGTTLAGGVIMGDDVLAGVGVTIAPSVCIGSGVTLSSGAVATKNVPDGMHVSGNFAIDHAKYLKHIKAISSVDE
ncbi:MAG: hypothetical protein IKS87_01320 [Lachnospiraceae bacterium]|nr:hypothetical protein [Lachnospiraceae bacterium]